MIAAQPAPGIDKREVIRRATARLSDGQLTLFAMVGDHRRFSRTEMALILNENPEFIDHQLSVIRSVLETVISDLRKEAQA